MAAKKKGTPPARPVRTVAFRVTEDEYWGLMIAAEKAGMDTLSRFIRNSLGWTLESAGRDATMKRNAKRIDELKQAEADRKRAAQIKANTIAAWNSTNDVSHRSDWD